MTGDEGNDEGHEGYEGFSHFLSEKVGQRTLLKFFAKLSSKKAQAPVIPR